MMNPATVLFLCTGNAARSQMAEGLVNHYLAGRWQAFSAGTHPAGAVHPLAIQIMAELGIDLSAHRSKSLDDFQGRPFDLVITLCDDAAQECPAWPGAGRVLHLGFPDPVILAAGAAADERLTIARTIRDDIREQVLQYLEAFQASPRRLTQP
jgi:arsenate reductase